METQSVEQIQLLRRLEGEFTQPYEEKIAELQRDLDATRQQFQQLRAKIPDTFIELLNQPIPEEKVYRVKGAEIHQKLNQLAVMYYPQLSSAQSRAGTKHPVTQLIQDLLECLTAQPIRFCRLNSMLINNEIKIQDG